MLSWAHSSRSTHLHFLAIASKSVGAWRPVRTAGTLLGPRAQHLAFGTRPVRRPTGQTSGWCPVTPARQVKYCISEHRYREGASTSYEVQSPVSDAVPVPSKLSWRHACHLAPGLDLSSVQYLITSDGLCPGPKITAAISLVACKKPIVTGALAAKACFAPDCHAALKPTSRADVACAHA